jgi:alpha-galactosidase
MANKELFPGGLKATADAIRACGLVPGIWFEIETCGEHAAAYSRTAHLLHRDGVPVTVRGRRFWNMNDPEVVRYLSEHVIDVLERCGFGYLKIDYNETLGIGCEEDGGGSQGEGLRRQVEGMYRFLDRIRARLPELVIENCASGGHRHEPSMLARTALSSFSDAHELREIPVIAANLQRLILPRQCLVWAVLHADDTEQRLIYSLAATFLGRMCLSGEIDRLSAEQWALVERTIALYQKAAPIIKQGVSRRFGAIGESWRHPEGWQAVVRTTADAALVVAHGFAGAPARALVRLPAGAWKIVEQLHAKDAKASVAAGELVVPFEGAFSGCVALLRR